ncbi:glycoside hydrolase family 16 protein [Kineococcus sp. SYSU DK005]|uniref:glycoside hydrolase family 16 protein n=1 Tax=Kineococcus sp. SYSU DK005 TaxID=3383126 RepID=UPI003D7E2058
MTASSSLAGTAPANLLDGSFSAGVGGQQWTAAAGDAAPWVRLGWSSPRRIASVQVLGPAQAASTSTAPGAVDLHGRLRFSDGSSVVVSGIAGGGNDPTTIAFAPREVTAVRLELERTEPGAVLGLREFAAYDAGTTPPKWPYSATGYSTTPAAAQCGATSPAVAPRPANGLALVCPAPGSVVGSTATVVVWAPPGTSVTARGWRLDKGTPGVGSMYWAGAARAGADGRAVITVNTQALPKGPTALKVSRTDGTGAPLYVQVVNGSGRSVPTPATVPAGMGLRYSDDFSAPLSVDWYGSGAAYAATKPEPFGDSEFGMAAFVDPAVGTGTMATIPGGYLRLRAEPIAGRKAWADWGQKHFGGLLSSARIGGGGFSAQYGYFEARMLGAPGPGAWPAFWMLNTENATPRFGGKAAEVDAVELYGHDTAGSCHLAHSWGTTPSPIKGGSCLKAVQPADWAASWHTYGARITPGGATFYVDGVEVTRVTGLTHTEEPFFFLLNLALSHDWPIDLSRTGETTDLYVDWVRVYT